MSGRRDGGAVVRVERRRHWSDEEKLAILKETTQPGVIVAEIARRHGIGTGQLYTWRKQLLQGAMAGFVPVELTSSEPTGTPVAKGRIEITGHSAFTVSVDGCVDRDAVWTIPYLMPCYRLDEMEQLGNTQGEVSRVPGRKARL